MAADHPSHRAGSRFADRVQFIDEHNAGRVLLRLLEQIANPRRAQTDKQLDELGAGNRKEGRVGLAGDGTRQQRLSGTRRAYEEDALGNAPTQPLVLVWMLQEINDFNQLSFGLIHAGYI